MSFPRPTLHSARASRRCVLALLLGVLFGAGFPELGAAPIQVPWDSDYLVDIWETEDGLPQNSATSIVQAPDGYLWFGTFNGLVRFDGIRFRVFDRASAPGFPSAAVVRLEIDPRGRLWVGTDFGVARLDEGGEWQPLERREEWRRGIVLALTAHRDGALYFSTSTGGLYRADDGGIAPIERPHGAEPGEHVNLFNDAAGSLWGAVRHALGRWAGDRWEYPIAPSQLGPDPILGAAAARSGGIWVATKGAIREWDGGGWSRRLAPPDPLSPCSMLEDSGRRLWAGTWDQGLLIFHPSGRIDHYHKGNSLRHNCIRALFEDREGNIWAGTDGGGLARFKPRAFITFGEESGFIAPVVKAVAEAGAGKLWVGTHGAGLFLLDGQRALPADFAATGGRWVWSLLVDGAGTIWWGSFEEGLHRYDGGVAEAFRLGDDGGGGDGGGLTVHSIYQDSRGELWIGANRGLGRIDADGSIGFVGEDRGLLAKSVRWITEDAAGDLWVGSYDSGLYRGRGRGDRFQRYTTADGLSSDQIWCLKADADGTLWIGTYGGGITRYRAGAFAPITEAQGLPARNVTCFLEDDQGHLWIGTNRGVLRARRESLHRAADGQDPRLEFLLFDHADGLRSIECTGGNQNAGVRQASGRLCFATLKGVACVEPAKVRTNVVVPPVIVEELVFDAQPGPADPLGGAGAKVQQDTRARLRPSPSMDLVLPAGSRHLEIHYTGLSFTAPEKVRFEYQLEGADGGWVDAGGRRIAYFHDLPPGSYRFRVRAANNDGVWNDDGAAVDFQIRPFYWQTAWFRASSTALTLGILGVAVWRLTRARWRRQVERLERERELSSLQARLALVLENTSDFVGFADAERRPFYLNSAGKRMIGLEDDADIREYPLARIYAPWAYKLVTEVGLPAAKRDGVWQGESALLHRDGREIPVSQVLLVHRRPDGAHEFTSTIARDVSAIKKAEGERRALEAQLHHAQKLEALGTLAGGIAHDFNNILGAILGNAELLRASLDASAPVQDHVSEIEKAGQRARDLVLQILAFSRRQDPQRRPLRLDGAVRDALRLLRATLPATLEIRFEADPATPAVSADAVQIHQVLMNLCTNAWHAVEGRSQPRLDIMLAPARIDAGGGAGADLQPGLYARLSVRDNGIGMEPLVLERIFEPFFTTKPTGLGTGLGLSVVHGIVENHGGAIRVESRPGEGSAFHLYFPAEEQEAGAPEPASPRQALPAGSGERVLYIDDEEAMALLVERSLERLGYRVTASTSPAAALAAFRARPGDFDVAVTDYHMPAMNGRELIQALRGVRNDLPIVVTTGFLRPEDAEELRRLGIQELVQKPDTVDGLIQALHRIFARLRGRP